jgi:GNAT superfamily N-acetyltransferase
MKEVKVEKLTRADGGELLELFTCAFRGHPLSRAAGIPPEKIGILIKAFYDLFAADAIPLLCGIRRDNRLVCASLSTDSGTKPPLFALLRFIVTLRWYLGRRITKGFMTVSRQMPKYGKRYLELELFGTLPSCRRQGLGRRMMRFLYAEARRREYGGVTLATDSNSPAFQFYLKEGFHGDREIPFGNTTLSCMRLEFS